MDASLLRQIRQGDRRSLARTLSMVENQRTGIRDFLTSLPVPPTPVIGITGPPGAGKSTLLNAMIRVLTGQGKKTGVLCVDPSSPFHSGALLGDRVRLQQWHDHPDVYIRSLSTRGSLGGLHPRLFEMTDLLKAAGFDYVIVETVGTGQTEMDIARLADQTLLVLMPGAGDEVQAMKSGIMEIADLFVVNKSDHPGANQFLLQLRSALAMEKRPRDIVATVATEQKGISELMEKLSERLSAPDPEKKQLLLVEKAFRLILADRMQSIDRNRLDEDLQAAGKIGEINVYRFVAELLRHHL